MIPPRFAGATGYSDATSNDQMYGADQIGPVVTGSGDDEGVVDDDFEGYWDDAPEDDDYEIEGEVPDHNHIEGVLGSHLLFSDALPQQGDITDNMDQSSTTPDVDMTPGMTPSNDAMNDPMSAGDATGVGAIPTGSETGSGKNASWKGADFRRVLATDSDLYELGYKDRLDGKEMDQGLANLSQDYYQGYNQAGFYFERANESAPQNLVDIDERYKSNDLPRNPVASRQVGVNTGSSRKTALEGKDLNDVGATMAHLNNEHRSDPMTGERSPNKQGDMWDPQAFLDQKVDPRKFHMMEHSHNQHNLGHTHEDDPVRGPITVNFSSTNG